MAVRGIKTLWKQDINLLVVMIIFWQVDIKIWQVNIKIWQVDIIIWQVDIIIWQVMAEICHHKNEIASALSGYDERILGKATLILLNQHPLLSVTLMQHIQKKQKDLTLIRIFTYLSIFFLSYQCSLRYICMKSIVVLNLGTETFGFENQFER